jgi:transposase-like protein
MTVWIAVECPNCHSTNVSKNGSSAEGKQRYLCKNPECPHRTFILDCSYLGRTRSVKQQIIEMSLNGSGVRDIARVLKVGVPTVIRELKKKKSQIKLVNQKALENLKPEQVEVEIQKVEEDEEKGEENSNSGVEESELDAPVELCRK